MKISLTTLCKDCNKWYNFFAEVNDQNTYEYTCPRGHKCYSKLQMQKFQILLELGSLALLDGYTREAVSSLSAALERFFEFYLGAFCITRKIPASEFQDTFNLMSSQSERQLGAFYFCRLMNQNKSPQRIPNKWIEFRNDVVHKGHIPASKKVIEYGDFVVSYIYSALDDFKNDEGHQAIIKLTNDNLSENLPDSPFKINMTMASILCVVNLQNISNDKFKRSSFSDYMAWLPKQEFYKKFYRRK